MKVCTVAGCETKVLARGWCSLHYQRWRHHGDPLAGGPSPKVRRVVDNADGTRQCTVCERDLPFGSFSIDKTATGGRRSHCRECRNAKMADWYATNQQRQADRATNRRERDRDVIRLQDMARYERSREKRIELATEHGHRRRIRMAGTTRDRGITRVSLRKRDGDWCCHCGITMTFEAARGHKFIPSRATIEHLLPLSRGGSHTWDNVALACWQCNVRRNNQALDLWRERLSKEPRVEAAVGIDGGASLHPAAPPADA